MDAVEAQGEGVEAPGDLSGGLVGATAGGAEVRTSGKRGATKEVASDQYAEASGLLDRAMALEEAMKGELASPAVTGEDLELRLGALDEVWTRFDAVDLSAVAAVQAKPLLLALAARRAKLELIAELMDKRRLDLGSGRSRRGSVRSGSVSSAGGVGSKRRPRRTSESGSAGSRGGAGGFRRDRGRSATVTDRLRAMAHGERVEPRRDPTGKGRLSSEGAPFHGWNTAATQEQAPPMGARMSPPPWSTSVTGAGSLLPGSAEWLQALRTDGSTHLPTWMSTTNPYDPAACALGEDYYLSFPYPWNAKPQSRGVSPNDLLKIAAANLPKFDGERRNYLMWRSSFLPCVHLAPVDVSIKVMLLRSSMLQGEGKLVEFVENLVGTPEGYRAAIHTLEERYGGEETLLLLKQSAILDLPTLKEGQYTAIETLSTRLRNYLMQWAACYGPNPNPAAFATFYSQLMANIELRFRLKYISWANQNRGGEKTLQSLQVWLGQQLESHRQAMDYSKVAAVTSSAARAPQRVPFRSSLRYKAGPAGTRPDFMDRREPERFFYGEENGGEAEAEEEEIWDEDAALVARTAESVRPTPAPSVRGKGVAPASGRAPCPCCGGEHALGRCFQFRDLSSTQKRAFLVKHKRCFLCFKTGHGASACEAAMRCHKCNGKHNTAVHTEPQADTALVAGEPDEEMLAAEEMMSYGMVSLPVRSVRVSLRTVPVVVENPCNGHKVVVNALLDDGCTSAALISRELAVSLGLKGKAITHRTEGVGGHITTTHTISAPVRVARLDGCHARELIAQVMDRPAGTYEPVDWTKLQEGFEHLAKLPLAAPAARPGVDILLGNQCPTLMSSIREVTAGPEDPVGRLTLLGWTVAGPTATAGRAECQDALRQVQRAAEPSFLSAEAVGAFAEGTSSDPKTLGRLTVVGEKVLAQLVERMLRVEDPGEAEVLSPREQYLINHLRSTLVKVGGRYQAACTWLPGGERPTLNYKQALNRLESLEASKYFRDQEIKAGYARAIQQWEDDKHVTRVKMGPGDVRLLLPHFPIIKQSSSTPVRPVMDCKVVLNKFCMSGPNILNNVPAVLLRFISGLVAFSGDVKQMFLQIRLRPEDRPYHCFLWRTEPQQEPTIFRFNSHVFGNTGSPFVAVFVLKEHATAFKEQHPQAVEALVHSTLIDDVLDSLDQEDRAIETMAQIRKILGEASMRLTKCHSNSRTLLSSLPFEDVAEGIMDLTDACSTDAELTKLKTLGIRYDHNRDCFLFHMETPTFDRWTKRKVLQTFPMLFDPLGLLLPFTITARIYFSELVRAGYDWNHTIPPDPTWHGWLDDLSRLSELSVPRCIKTFPATAGQLHVFVDASAKAYAAAAYVRTESNMGTVTVRLAMAKAHVAPTKQQSIPRLELLAAELGVKLRNQVVSSVKIELPEVHFWTDSVTVLYWLHDDKRGFQAFVANRLANIRRVSDLQEWHYVPTKDNPADHATRGLTAGALLDNTSWYQGAAFLLKSSDSWPDQPPLVSTTEVLQELKKTERLFVATEGAPPREAVIPFSRYSSWQKLRRIVMVILKWRARAASKTPTDQPDLWSWSEVCLLRQVQIPLYKAMKRDSTKQGLKILGVLQLQPYVDESGLIRGRGRGHHVMHLPKASREPILLPKGSYATTLIVRYIHEHISFHYGGVNYTLSRFMAKFWTSAARRLVKGVIQNCTVCRRRLARPTKPPEGLLPAFRFPPATGCPKPFDVAALDCAGPFKVKRARSTINRYMLLITCCHFRAVRLECLTDLSTDAFLMALTRVSARGVNPTSILSDNGGNFNGANSLLRYLWQQMPQRQLEARRPDIKWRFNPPYASHYGGVFERLIGAAKQALYHALPSSATVTEEQLSTAFASVEAVLNARPLAYFSATEMDLRPLTPNHFLYGASSEQVLDTLPMEDISCSLAKQWASVAHTYKLFLRAFHDEIVPFLQLSRRTNDRRVVDLQVGDVVIFFLPSQGKRWPLARVAQVFPGPDGRVRMVSLALPGGQTVRRDARRVAVLLRAGEETHDV